MGRRKTLKLSTPEEIRKAMARIANMVLNNELEPKEANTLLYACNSTLNAIRTDDYKKKVEELEVMLMEQEKKEN